MRTHEEGLTTYVPADIKINLRRTKSQTETNMYSEYVLNG